MDNSKCIVLVPFYQHIDPACEESLKLLELQGYTVRRIRGGAAIDVARSRIATAALDDGFDELMWIDSDIAFEQDAVDRLRAHGLPFVSGIYPKKEDRGVACHVVEESGRQPHLELGSYGGLHELHYAGAGFLYTTRQVYEDIQRICELPLCNVCFGDRIVPYFLSMVVLDDRGGHWYLGEDFSFCERARRAGHRVIADTTIRLFHVGRYAYSWEDAEGDRPRYSGMRIVFDPSRRKEEPLPQPMSQGKPESGSKSTSD